MIFLTLWFCFGIGCGLLAQRKNRNTVAWVILGFLFGIFALGILLLLPSLEKRWR